MRKQSFLMNKKLLILISFILIITYFFQDYFNVNPINESTKTCLITGASSGIGYELSKEMIRRGWKVIGIARSQENLDKARRELGNGFIQFKCDVSKQNQVHNISDKIKEIGLQPTLFFLNAGTGELEESFKPILNKHKMIFNTNYFGTIAWIDEWINNVRNYGGGRFIATSSVNAIFSSPAAAGYCASKSALNATFKSLRLKYLNNKIGFVIVMPGPVDTNMLKSNNPVPFTHKPSDEAKYIIKKVFAGKIVIEPSFSYSCYYRILNFLPDWLVLKFIN